MKNKYLLIGLSAVISVVLLSGCTKTNIDIDLSTAAVEESSEIEVETTLAETEIETITEAVESESETETEQETEASEESLYKDVLDKYYDIISTATNEYDYGEGETGIYEVIIASGNDAALKSIGYCINDISGDGVPELIIGSIPAGTNELSSIFAVYSLVNEQPKLTFEGWSRNCYNMLNDNHFLLFASNGAIYSIFGEYMLSADGAELVCRDYYFSFEKDETFEEIGYYHNTSGTWDKAASEELNIDEEAFWKLESEIESKVITPDFTPFSDYQR